MYAVIEQGGQQFRVSEGDELNVDLMDLEEGTEQVAFQRVLLLGEEGDVKVGTPLVDGATVHAEVLNPEFKGEKTHSYYWRRRKNSRKKTGHRQRYTRVRIRRIEG